MVSMQFVEIHQDIIDHLANRRNRTSSVITALSTDGLVSIELINGNTNAEVFLTLLGEALFLICMHLMVLVQDQSLF